MLRGAATTVSFAVLFAAFAHYAQAGIFDNLLKRVFAYDSTGDKQFNAQNVPLLSAAVDNTVTADDYIASDQGALLSASGPAGGVAEMTDLQVKTAVGEISTYEVQDGDTIASIADTYGISANTIVWANHLDRKSKLKVGQTLVILPISGVQHKVRKGDTIAKIAKLYNGDQQDIIDYNGLDDSSLVIGETITIPDGEMPAAPVPAKVKKRYGKISGIPLGSDGGPDAGDYYLRPVLGCIKTQGIHGHNGVDLGCPIGTPVRAAAPGTIIIASVGGWGGGYGNYIVIKHTNGTQTVYGHLSRVDVSVGQSVGRGEPIGATGNSGKSTGPHLHVEVRGARNPF